jgi:hypothetical protein
MTGYSAADWREGWEAFVSGQMKSDNPHRGGKSQLAWDRGWEYGEISSQFSGGPGTDALDLVGRGWEVETAVVQLCRAFQGVGLNPPEAIVFDGKDENRLKSLLGPRIGIGNRQLSSHGSVMWPHINGVWIVYACGGVVTEAGA